MLDLYLHDYSDVLRFQVKGDLVNPWAEELKQCWQTAESIRRKRQVVVDLVEVAAIDAYGESVVELLAAHGATVVRRPSRRQDATSGVITDRIASEAANCCTRIFCWFARCCGTARLARRCAS